MDLYDGEPGFIIFERYRMGRMIKEHEINKLRDYLAGQFISWSPNKSYYADWYNECNNLFIVINWRKKNFGVGCGSVGERVCYKNSAEQIVDLFLDKDHIKKNNCNCNKLEVFLN